MTVKQTHAAAATPTGAARNYCTVYFSRSLTRTLVTIVALVAALALIITLS
ncbi:hypothetical protein GCM10027289_25020 [Tsukamurella serpentis]